MHTVFPLDCISGPDDLDSTSLRVPYQSCNDQFTDDSELTNITVGIPKVCIILTCKFKQ